MKSAIVWIGLVFAGLLIQSLSYADCSPAYARKVKQLKRNEALSLKITPMGLYFRHERRKFEKVFELIQEAKTVPGKRIKKLQTELKSENVDVTPEELVEVIKIANKTNVLCENLIPEEEWVNRKTKSDKFDESLYTYEEFRDQLSDARLRRVFLETLEILYGKREILRKFNEKNLPYFR